MVALEVFVNGQSVCTAGVGEYGVLTSMVTWVRRDAAMRTAPPGSPPVPEEELTASVSGLTSDPSGASVHLKWFDQPLHVGSEVRIRVVEVLEGSPPTHREREKPSFVDRRKREYYEHLKREYGE